MRCGDCDALQLVAALEVKAKIAGLVLMSAHATLNGAALAKGLPVEDPIADL